MSYLNTEGLTYMQWLAVATQHGRKPNAQELAMFRREWRTGVDPTEWAAYLSQ